MSGWTVVVVVAVWCLVAVPLGIVVGRALARRRTEHDLGSAVADRHDRGSSHQEHRAS